MLQLGKNTRVTHNVMLRESHELMLEPLPKKEIHSLKSLNRFRDVKAFPQCLIGFMSNMSG